ncbi:hypothetical protein SRB17_17480 [Streptomyces sp. RB17]|nr:hypothetical protein [Streptomyces sp. RB17]
MVSAVTARYSSRGHRPGIRRLPWCTAAACLMTRSSGAVVPTVWIGVGLRRPADRGGRPVRGPMPTQRMIPLVLFGMRGSEPLARDAADDDRSAAGPGLFRGRFQGWDVGAVDGPGYFGPRPEKSGCRTKAPAWPSPIPPLRPSLMPSLILPRPRAGCGGTRPGVPAPPRAARPGRSAGRPWPTRMAQPGQCCASRLTGGASARLLSLTTITMSRSGAAAMVLRAYRAGPPVRAPSPATGTTRRFVSAASCPALAGRRHPTEPPTRSPRSPTSRSCGDSKARCRGTSDQEAVDPPGEPDQLRMAQTPQVRGPVDGCPQGHAVARPRRSVEDEQRQPMLTGRPRSRGPSAPGRAGGRSRPRGPAPRVG